MLLPALLLSAVTLAQPQYPLRRIPYLTYTVDYEPFWSPDGQSVVLISSRHGGMKVHILSMKNPGGDGSSMKQITFGPDEDDMPSWSPDGKKIAFVSDRKDVSQLFVMNADGSGVRQLTTGTYNNIHPTWSPDSKRILFNTLRYEAENRKSKGTSGATRTIGEAIDAYMDLATINPDGTDWTRVTTGGGYTYASYSPNGQQILARRTLMPAGSEIHVMNADTSGERNLSAGSHSDGWPSWAPDGKRVVFTRQIGEGMQIFVENVDGTGLLQATDAKGELTNPRWSPDGKNILCQRRPINGIALLLMPAPPP